MEIFVGSTNPVKINAVVQAASERWPSVRVVSVDVPSGVAAQPKTDSETRQGANNRALSALSDGLKERDTSTDDVLEVLAIGLEGGIFEDDANQMWMTVWAVVVDAEENVFEANGSRFKIDEVIAEKIRNGEEMGPAIDQVTGGSNIRQQQGLIGVVTENFIDRTEEYAAIAKLALGLWYGRNWQSQLHQGTT